MDNATILTQEGQTGPWAPSYFVEVPQYHTWDAWCAGLRTRFEPIAASIAARQKLRTWRQLGSVQDYTSGFLALCEQVGYMHESERIDRYIGGLKHDIAQEIQLRGITDFQEILVMAEKLDFFRRPRPGSYAPWPLGPSAPRPLGPFVIGPAARRPSAPATTATTATTTVATTATAATTAATADTATAALACCATLWLSLRVLAFDHEGRPIQFDTWVDDLQLYLPSDSKDSVSLFDLASGAATAPPARADSATRSQWLTRNAAARFAIRNHLPLAECAHFGQHWTAQALYDADLVSHLHTSDARYRATVLAKFLDRNQPPMFITLYFIVTRLPESLRSVMDHVLSLDPTSLTVDLLEQHLLATETSAVVVGAARGTPRPPFFEGCSPSPLAPSYASSAASDVPGAKDVEATFASAKRRNSKGKGGRGGGGGGSGSGGGGSSGGGGGSVL
ncbi:unnamed protein product [Closterium sp. NIES-53]